jgi:sialate O-acetylesterase
MRLWFDHVGSGLAARDGGILTGFAIAGPDGKFAPAEAKIEGGTVVVRSPEVQSPAAVRYAWADDPTCNLINKEGLPASPFRTDRWEIK